MPEINISFNQLRGMIGKAVWFNRKSYQVIEVLEASHELVLQHADQSMEIQPDQYGDAHRRVPEVTTVPVLTADKREFHPNFLNLDLL